MHSIPTTAWKFLAYGVRPRRRYFFGALILIATAAVIHQATPYLFKLIVDAVSEGDTSLIPLYVALYPLTFLIVEVIYRLSAILVAQVCIPGKEYLYNQLSTYMLSHSHSYFADRMAGSLMTKVSTAVNAFENFIEYVLWNYLDAAITFSATLIFIAFVNTPAALVLLGIFSVLFVINYVMVAKSQSYASKSAAAQSAQGGVIVDILSNTNIVRQFGRTRTEQQAIADVSHMAKRAEFGTRYFGEWMLAINGVVITIGFALMMWVLVDGYQAKSLTAGDMVFVLSLLMGMAYQLLFLGTAFQSGSQQFGQLKDALKELLVPHEIVDHAQATELSVTDGVIQFSNVQFSYEQTTVFRDFSLRVSGGQRVGLVGTSGAGKSTLVSLILKQYEIQSGDITIDDQSLATITQDSLRAAIAVVPQEPALFHRSIRDNIAYGKPDATDAEIVAVAKQAHAHDFIDALPQKYDTLVGERGVKLSGGQKQRIAIARAMLKNAPILILDEATSALDSESEVAIQKALHTLMAGKTVIAIAHRLSTLHEMDRIIVLEKGLIIEDGTHDTLVAYSGVYAALWNHQAGGFVGKGQ